MGGPAQTWQNLVSCVTQNFAQSSKQGLAGSGTARASGNPTSDVHFYTPLPLTSPTLLFPRPTYPRTTLPC